jgi:hypothetical protein
MVPSDNCPASTLGKTLKAVKTAAAVNMEVIGAILSKAVAQGRGDKAIPAICEVLSSGRDVK